MFTSIATIKILEVFEDSICYSIVARKPIAYPLENVSSLWYNRNMKTTYRHSNTSVSMVNFHLMFCPRFRRKIFLIDGVEARFKELVHQICEQNDFEVLAEEKEWHGGVVLYEEEYPNILFAQDGEIYDFDGKKAIVIGGAYSVDKYYSLSGGALWFESEQPDEK